MKTKTLIVIGVIGMAIALAPKARAGWSIGISLGIPVACPAPVYVAPPPAPVYVAPAPVVYTPPPVVYAPAPVYVAPAPVCRPAVFIPPGHAKKLYSHHGPPNHGWGGHGYRGRH